MPPELANDWPMNNSRGHGGLSGVMECREVGSEGEKGLKQSDESSNSG